MVPFVWSSGTRFFSSETFQSRTRNDEDEDAPLWAQARHTTGVVPIHTPDSRATLLWAVVATKYPRSTGASYRLGVTDLMSPATR